MSRAVRVAAGLLAAAAAAGCGSHGGDPGVPSPEHPPIVFVSIDTLAAGHLSLYGYPRETSPELEELARSSVVFDHCWSNAPWTTPSYMSQLTGVYPGAHRVRQAVAPKVASGEDRTHWLLRPGWQTLPEALAARGYRTAAFVDNPNIPASFGFDQGFERYDTTAVQVPPEDPDGGIRLVSRLGLGWIDAWDRRAPAFLFLQAWDPHGPYLPPPEFVGRFDADALWRDAPDAPVAEDWHTIFRAIPRYIVLPLEKGVAAPPARRPTRPLIDSYDEEIAATDAAIGALVDSLRERDLLDRVVLVVSADHGESMVEGDSFFAHQLLQEEVLHVPLLVRLPGGAHGGRRVADPVQLVDLYPTLLELAGVPFEPADLHGRSLVPLLEGRSLPAEVSFAQADLFHSTAVRAEGYELVTQTPDPETAGPRGFASSRWAADWLSEHAGIDPAVVLGTREHPLADVANDLPPGTDVERLWKELQSAVCEPHEALYRIEGDVRRPLSVESQPRIAERLRALAAAEEARARAAWPRGGPEVDAPATDEETRSALDQLGY